MNKLTHIENQFIEESNYVENEWSEKALKDAIKAWKFLKSQDTLTIENILKTHAILMDTRTTINNAFKGKFRSFDVMISGHPERELTMWQDVPERIKEWIWGVNEFVRSNPKPDKDTASVIKRDHILFETIHPIADGNGRLGRLLMNWERIACGLPIQVIRYIERGKYYAWFSNQDK